MYIIYVIKTKILDFQIIKIVAYNDFIFYLNFFKSSLNNFIFVFDMIKI